MIIRVGHLYPEYLNIYADRGNIAVFTRRAAARGHELRVDPVTLDTPLEPGSHDLLYVGGGQDREQAMIAPTSPRAVTRSAPPSRAAPRSSPSVGATSCSGAGIAGATAPGSRARASSRTRRSPARPA